MSTILFDADRIYNAGSPSGAASITLDFTGAVAGSQAQFVSDGTAFTIQSVLPVYLENSQPTGYQSALFLRYDGFQVFGSFASMDAVAPISLFRIGYVSDSHYDPTVTGPPHALSRADVLTYLGNFNAAMTAEPPDLIIHAGDKTGVSNTNQTAQLEWYQATMDAIPGAVDGIAPGNHDFEYMSFASVLAKHPESWRQPGNLYGHWDQGGYRFITLDANYLPGTQTHRSLDHVGYGYVNTDQLAWLSTCLEESPLPVIVNCHQLLGEFETDLFFLDQETYSVQNRAAVRSILKASGKVITVIHGHLHFARTNVVEGIPYISCPSLSFGHPDASRLDFPLKDSDGQWLQITIDSDAQTIKTDAVGWFDAPQTKLSQTVSWGPTTAADVLIDPSEFRYIPGNASNVVAFPGEIGQPRISDRTVLIECRAGGSHVWDHPPKAGVFGYSLSFRVESLARRYIHAGDSVLIRLDSGGTIYAKNGATETAIGGYTAGVWYALEIGINPVAEIFGVWLDDVELAMGFAMSASESIQSFEIGTDQGRMWIDGLRVNGMANDLLNSLISHWAMDESSGNATDSHGSNTLTDNNTVGAATGKVSGARDFESANSEYFSIASNSELQTGDIDFSFSCWVKFESIDVWFVVSKGQTTLGTREYGIFISGGALKFFVVSSGDTQTIATSAASISTATWYHVYAYHDAADNEIGIVIDDGTPDTAAHSAGVRSGSVDFEIGARSHQSLYFDGLIDEVSFWKRLLTAAEITDVYNSGSGRAYSYYENAAAGGARQNLLLMGCG